VFRREEICSVGSPTDSFLIVEGQEEGFSAERFPGSLSWNKLGEQILWSGLCLWNNFRELFHNFSNGRSDEKKTTR
jgi:hypothetical protein